MIIHCKNCRVALKLNEQVLNKKGSKVRCKKCRHVFIVYPNISNMTPPSDSLELFAQKTINTEFEPSIKLNESAVGSGSPDMDAASSERESEVEQTVHGGILIEPGSLPAHSTFEEVKFHPEKSGQKTVVTPVSDSREDTNARRAKRKYMPFKTKLILFACLIIGVIAIIVIPVEISPISISRPYQKLIQLIENGKNLIGGTVSSFKPEEIERMNRLAMRTIPETRKRYDEMGVYDYLAFNILIMEESFPAEETILEKNEEEIENFNYEKLLFSKRYWENEFENDPGIREIFTRYKKILRNAKQNAEQAGFDIADIFIMLDTGKNDGYFQNRIAFLLEGYAWWEAPSFPGEPCPITRYNKDWRSLSLSGKAGYDHAPLHDPDNFYLPLFDKDEWGTWFCIWLTQKIGNNYDLFCIDVEASSVKKLMMQVAAWVIVTIVFLSILVAFVTRRLSNLVTRPITELTKGAEEVAHGNYQYKVPVYREDEFGELTRQFNAMTEGQRERLNLMETLEKLLSKELAEKAAKTGLVLGGKKTEYTIMFTDFAGFSTITQKMNAMEVVDMLNLYYYELISIVKKYGGFPDKYIGDAIVALFGAPVPMEDHAERAVACAIDMQRKVREINANWRKQNKTVFEMRIGLNSGEVIAGAIGCDQKLEYTSIGETTTLANRMESTCDIGHITMAGGTYSRIEKIFFEGVHIGITPRKMKVKGYPKPVLIYNVYIDNLKIEKNLDAEGPIKYRYEKVDNHLKYHPDEIEGIDFKSYAKFL